MNSEELKAFMAFVRERDEKLRRKYYETNRAYFRAYDSIVADADDRPTETGV